MTVLDIYGSDYCTDHFNLPAHLVAAAFGKLGDPEQRRRVHREDLASSCLMNVLNIVGQFSTLHAQVNEVTQIIFIGGILAGNHFCQEHLSFLLEKISNGKVLYRLFSPIRFFLMARFLQVKAHFLDHEGYHGALGVIQTVFSRRNEEFSSPKI